MFLHPSEEAEKHIGFPSALHRFGISHRWVCVEAPANEGKSEILKHLPEALVHHLIRSCPALDMCSASEVIESSVRQIRQPGAVVGGFPLRDAATSAEIPEAARFALFMADRIIQNKKSVDLLESHSFVIQERGAFSTYAYQCVEGGVPFSAFETLVKMLVPDRPDLMILLSGECDGSRASQAYSKPPTHVLKLCAKNVALVSTEGRTPEQLAHCIVDAICGRSITIPLA
jgi:hypothetical protein